MEKLQKHTYGFDCHVYSCLQSFPSHQSFTVSNLSENNVQVSCFSTLVTCIFVLLSTVLSVIHACNPLVKIKDKPEPRAGELVEEGRLHNMDFFLSLFRPSRTGNCRFIKVDGSFHAHVGMNSGIEIMIYNKNDKTYN